MMLAYFINQIDQAEAGYNAIFENRFRRMDQVDLLEAIVAYSELKILEQVFKDYCAIYNIDLF